MRAFLKSIYQSLYAHLPGAAAEKLSDVAFVAARRPLVYHDPKVHPRDRLTRGAVTLSIDFELAWAYQYAKDAVENCVTTGLRERANAIRILEKLNEFDVPASWATVGHLFLEKCARREDCLAHHELPRVPHFDGHWRFLSGDWFQHDPCTDVRRDPAWYAPDLIGAIAASKTKHELACHGFSHLGFGAYVPDHVIEAEVDACLAVMKPFGVRPVSLVFPGNEVGKFDLLARKGFKIVRAFPVSWAEVSLPMKMQGGMWGTQGSIAVDTDAPSVNLQNRFKRLCRFVDRASDTKLNAHIWFHPSLSREQMEMVLFPLVEYIARRRERGEIQVLTMAELATATEEALAKEGRVVG